MLIDYEGVVAELKVFLETKDGHGRRELHQTISELEAKHSIKEGTLEKALRISGNKVSIDLVKYPGEIPDGTGVDGAGANGNGSHPIAVTQ